MLNQALEQQLIILQETLQRYLDKFVDPPQACVTCFNLVSDCSCIWLPVPTDLETVVNILSRRVDFKEIT